jgi:hypothetical protein
VSTMMTSSNSCGVSGSTSLVAVDRSRLKLAACWIVVALGVFVGLCALSVFGSTYLPFADCCSGWFLRWLAFAGVGLFAAGFLAGSLAAVRNPRRAGIVFLTFLPITAFCLAYPSAGFLVWRSDGSGWFETPLPLTAIGLTLLFFGSILAPILALRHRKRAAIVAAVAAVVAIPVFVHSRWTSALLPRLGVTSVPFLLFGLFWLATNKFHWPILKQSRPHSVARQIAGVAITCVALLCAAIAGSAGRTVYFSSLFNGDCGETPPFTHARSNSDAVFTARVIYVGLSLPTQLEIRHQPEAIHDPRAGEWAVGVVEERFWGVPSHWPGLVLMTNYIYWKGATYFIDGGREQTLVEHVVPIVSAGIGCSRSRAIQDAIVDLRILHQAAPKGAAIVGRVRQPGPYSNFVRAPAASSYLAGARIDVSGPSGTTSVTTDASGIYQLEGLPAGDYTVELHVPQGETVGRTSFDRSIRKLHLKSDELAEESFDLQKTGDGAKQH